jgi:DNA (cytosine-5)-methyltransferase 1
VIDVREVGVPQFRKRLLLIGHKGADYPHAPWDTFLTIPESLGIRHMLKPMLEGAMEFPLRYQPQEQSPHYWIPTTETAPTGKPHPNLERLVTGKRNLSTKEKKEANRGEDEKVEYIEPNGLISFGVRKSSYHGQILDPDAPSKTIICAYNQCPRLFVGLYNAAIKKYWIRCLTYEECAQIQGFDASYPWQGSVKDKIVQIGNAVPPPLARTIATMLPSITFHSTPQVTTDTMESTSEEED